MCYNVERATNYADFQLPEVGRLVAEIKNVAI